MSLVAKMSVLHFHDRNRMHALWQSETMMQTLSSEMFLISKSVLNPGSFVLIAEHNSILRLLFFYYICVIFPSNCCILRGNHCTDSSGQKLFFNSKKKNARWAYKLHLVAQIKTLFPHIFGFWFLTDNSLGHLLAPPVRCFICKILSLSEAQSIMQYLRHINYKQKKKS